MLSNVLYFQRIPSAGTTAARLCGTRPRAPKRIAMKLGTRTGALFRPVPAGYPRNMLSWILRGMAAGAVGTTALNAASYFDMVLRGRPASRIPEESADRLSTITGVPVPGRGEQREHRLVGLGGGVGVAPGQSGGGADGA